ncbi:uncharacterized protein LOC123871563 isoform X2 [Maniola jurtina]|uniref:uncharacterized protein LOC123871563 isoform X2 n=1 Tax=Maniola jurtina TaxID=191418 RepID=UPI001E68D13F|nr:uncharacterized protein LOC123871563 isoform X2 [Maniola jurtina]
METATTSLEQSPASPVSENTELSGCLEPPATSNPPDSDQGSDEFNDGDCGEPLVGQRLVLDFTPTEEDTDYIQQKCCAFWEFVNKQAELEGLGALSDSEISEEMSDSGDYDYESTSEQPQSTPNLKSIEKTAVSMLELVEENGLIDRAFVSRLPTSHCSMGLTDYAHEKTNHAAKGVWRHLDPRLTCTVTSLSRRL